MADEAHLRDGTIIDLETGEIMEPPEETRDFRILAARRFLADTSYRKTDQLTPAELRTEVIELRRLLVLAVEVADDWAASFPPEVLDQQEEHVLIESP